MLSIGEFSRICKVSTKTLRYYAEVGLLFPSEINPENGYRYYAIGQLKDMLFINRLKSYDFSLDEIKQVLHTEDSQEEILFSSLSQKREMMIKKRQEMQVRMKQLEEDIATLKDGKSLMSYMDKIEIQLVDMPTSNILSIRKKVLKDAFKQEFINTFQTLLHTIQLKNLTITAPVMALYHEDEFDTSGLDTEFAIPIKETTKGTRVFSSGLCMKTTLHGSYSGLSSVYAKQREWAEKENYHSSNALYEIYVVDPSTVKDESDLVTEVYYPIKRK